MDAYVGVSYVVAIDVPREVIDLIAVWFCLEDLPHLSLACDGIVVLDLVDVEVCEGERNEAGEQENEGCGGFHVGW